MPSPSKRKRPTKSMDVVEVAAALTFGDAYGDNAAAERYGVSARTLQRYRQRIREGSAPELAVLVAEKRAAVAAKHRDQLDEVFGEMLTALKKRVQDTQNPMLDRDLVGAIKIVGDQRTTRDALDLGDDEFESDTDGGRVGGDLPGAPVKAAAGGAAGDETGPSAGTRRDSVH